jgi:gliding motility-associated-like protein
MRLRFGNTLANTPQIESAGLFLPLSSPCGFDMKQENGDWYMFVCNRSNSSISRLDFGGSLLNTPAGVYLPSLSYPLSNIDISLTQDCERTNGYVTNWVVAGVFMVHLQFDQGLAGPVTDSPVGATSAILNQPYGLSEIFREGDSLFLLAINNGSSMISRMTFPVCSDASIATWEGPDPPPVVYNNPGNYNIILRVDEGTANEQVFCQNIVVLPKPIFTLGSNRTMCDHDTAWLDPGEGFTSYLWSTGDTTRMLPVIQPGIYWVEVANSWVCKGRDSVLVTVNETFIDVVDTTICYGGRYWAQGSWQMEAGSYFDTLITIHDCDSVLQTNLMTEICTLRFWLPTAFTPNGDGLNDTFHPVAQNIHEYRLIIYDRWGQQLFVSTSIEAGWDGTFKGEPCESDIYSYIVFFQSYDNPGETEKRAGTMMLIR